MRFLARRSTSLLVTLLYLLVGGAEVLHQVWAEPVSGVVEAHVHNEGGSDDCPPPFHDELHCATCSLGGIRTLPASAPAGFAAAPSAPGVPVFHDGWTPSLHSHAPPSSRAPPLG